jgi:CheY-like chemotaxis protein
LQEANGDWLIERPGRVRRASPGDRADCAQLMLSLGTDAAAARSYIWINRGRLLKLLRPQSPKPQFDPDNSAIRVLVIDGDETVARRLRLQLRRLGYTVQFARSAYHANALPGDKHFDVLISDVGLPDIRHYPFLHDLQTETGVTGVILNSGAPESPREFFTKPVTAVELHNAIQRLLPTGAINQPMDRTIVPVAS